MLCECFSHGVEVGSAALVFEDPAACEAAVLDVFQDGFHVGLYDFFRKDSRSGDVFAEFCCVGDGVVHAGDALDDDQVDDQLQLVDALEVCVLGLVACFYQGLEAELHQLDDAAAKYGLLAEEVGLGLVAEGGLHDAGTCAADACDVCKCDVICLAGVVLLYCYEAGYALACNELAADGVARALRCCHEYVDKCGRNDLLIADVEAVRECDGLAFA